jgi:predicted component of type VI protein secretion system
MAYIVVSTEGRRPFRVSLEKAMIVGRSSECELRLDDRLVSREHCRLSRGIDSTEQWSLIDLSSRNGTIVAGQRTTFHRLSDGDEILIGSARLVYHVGEIPRARASDPVASKMEEVDDVESVVAARESSGGSRTAVNVVASAPIETAPLSPVGGKPLAFRRPPARPIVIHTPAPSLFRTIASKLRETLAR